MLLIDVDIFLVLLDQDKADECEAFLDTGAGRILISERTANL